MYRYNSIISSVDKILTSKALLNRKVFLRSKQVWTADRVVISPFDDVVIPDMTFSEYIWRNLNRWSDRTALVCGITDRSYTYNQVYNQSQKFAANLKIKFNIQDGDTVAIMMYNSPEYPAVIVGILAAGGVVTTMNPLYTAHELQRQILMSDTKLIVVAPNLEEVVKEALKLAKKEIPIIVNDYESGRPDQTVSYKELVENDVDLSILKQVKRNANDVAILPYSSGTTGLPKGVQLTHRNVVGNCVQQNTELRHFKDTTGTNQDTVLANLPFFHAYGMVVVLLQKLSEGLKLVTLPRFLPQTFVKALEKHKTNLFYVAPPNVMFMGFNEEVKAKHLEHTSIVISAAAPLPKADLERLMTKLNPEAHVGQAYGLTETSPVVTMSQFGFKKYESVGLPLPNVELRIVDSEMKNLGPNETGELLINGPNIMKGYRNDENANKQAFADTWFRSGDMAKIDEEGAVYIVDRFKELIKVNAYQVPPAELESLLKDERDVLDAAVVGIPDPAAGERPKAYVVIKEGAKISKEDIMTNVNKKVAPYKKIKEVEFVDSIPKNPSGKILRRLLKS